MVWYIVGPVILVVSDWFTFYTNYRSYNSNTGFMVDIWLYHLFMCPGYV